MTISAIANKNYSDKIAITNGTNVNTPSDSFHEIESILGPADYSSPGIRLYNRDCLAAIASLPPGRVHLTVTSPPYNAEPRVRGQAGEGSRDSHSVSSVGADSILFGSGNRLALWSRGGCPE